jgi:hypothetical protein
MNDAILDTLIAAHALLSPGPERWTRKLYARDRSGKPARFRSKMASCFCLMGSIRRCAPSERIAQEAGHFVKRTVRIPGIHAFNDDPNTTYEMVLSALTRSIDARRALVGEPT